MKTVWKIASGILAVSLLVWVLTLSPSGSAQTGSGAQRGPAGSSAAAQKGDDTPTVIVSDPVIPTLTGPVRDLPPLTLEYYLEREVNPRLTLNPGNPNFDPPSGPDPLLGLQEAAPEASAEGFDTPIFNFNGRIFTGANPPDTVGDVGKDHYIQMVNGSGTPVSIYNKTTGALIQSFALTSLPGCATGSGDPIVLYDQLADRWFLSEFGSGNSLCIYISTTPDPTGTYYSYQFTTPSFPDYPKYGVWSDAYYATANESSPSIYALNRAAMLTGAPATSQRFTAPGLAGFSFEALTPADLDGMTPPPAGTPNYIMRHVDTEAHSVPGYPTNDILEVWAFSVNWTTPASSTFTKIADILTAEFDSTLCGLTSFYCMGMPGVAQGATSSLDPLREVIMNRLAYRNFGDHQTLVGNFVTDIGSNIGGIRWFELRKVGAGAWALHQEGTYAPTTSDNRWMGGIAMDGSGNIALGYNVSSQTIYPSIRYTGRLVTDPLGTMPQGEYTLVNGSANNGSNRYGDYSAMSVDPIDDCTFWFTGQWNDASQWKTRIGAFKFDACGTEDFTLSATPASQDVCAATDAVYNVTVGQVQSYTDPVTLSASGNPAGTTATFSLNGQPAPYTSTLTIGNTGAAVAGSYAIDVVGVAPTSTHTTTVQLNLFTNAPAAPSLTAPGNGTINVPAAPTFTWSDAGATSYLLEVATDVNFNNIVYTANVNGTSHTAGATLNTSSTYFWRVQGSNTCGSGSYSAVFYFTTVAAPGDCGPGSVANVLYDYGFESGASGWTSEGTGNTWAIAASNPHSGASHYHGNAPAAVSDQRLISPPVVLPAGEDPVVLKFWHAPNLEANGATACYDGGILEVTTNGGTTWTQVPDSSLLAGGYTGTISSGFSNPLGGLSGWCGTNPQPYYQTIADVSAYAGQTAQFRMRLGTDTFVSRPGWDVDDVMVQSCTPAGGAASIALTKTVGTDPLVYPTTDVITVTSGVTVTYFYVVENTGTITLPLHTLNDSQLGTVLGPDFAYDLAPGELVTITADAVVTATVTNTAVWVATDGGATTAVANDSATVNVINLGISLSKTVGTTPGVCATGNAIEVEADTVVYYCYTVTNTGDEALALHDLEDDQLGVLFSSLAYNLAPGASVDTVAAGLTISATITGTTTNTAVWTAYNDATVSASASASATVTVTTYTFYLPVFMKP
ncbi:MAG: hypothetical protein IPM39_13690 [Chloroflexi bacterium]|nr:hypothetical protein [Chloroflexota bacterium]